MKPRLFVGSSRESVSIAYAAQQNLQHAAEVTVWDQGVFQLSVTAIESMLRILKTCDFAMFVFSPDDIVIMRGKKNTAIRDNIIFELGLFMGILGRERCFVLVPDDAKDVHIPTDLIGITSAVFETGRSDGNMQAATGPACHLMCETIGRLETRSEREIPPDSESIAGHNAKNETDADQSVITHEQKTQDGSHGYPDWFNAFVTGKYIEAIELLTHVIAEDTSGDEHIYLCSWLGRIKYYANHNDGTHYLEDLIKKYPTNEDPYYQLANAHIWRSLLQEALTVADRGLMNVGITTELIKIKVRCLVEMNRPTEAEDTLVQAIMDKSDNSDLPLALARFYSDKGDNDRTRTVLEDAEQQFPDNQDILDQYAQLLAKLSDKKLSLIPYERLVQLYPDNPTHLALRANSYLELDLYDHAIRDYKKASELAQDKQGWIIANIGNLLSNKGLYSDAIEYLKRAIELEPESEYAHNRLASAIKLRDAENEKLQQLLKDARRELVVSRLDRTNILPKETDVVA